MATKKRLIDLDESIDALGVEYEDIKCKHFLEERPIVDAVEVVRCKDCKHCTVTADGMVCECALPTKRMQDYYIYGSTILARVEPDAFCSHGERREGE